MKILLTLMVLMSAIISHAQDQYAASTDTPTVNTKYISRSKTIRKNILQVEVLGRSIAYGLSYERAFNLDVSVGAGFSYVSTSVNPAFVETKVQIIQVPLYVNYYAFSGIHNFVLSGGLNLMDIQMKANLSDAVKQAAASNDPNSAGSPDLLNMPDLNVSASAFFPIPQISAGYEYRSHSGFLARANMYGMYILGNVVPWIGLGLGVNF